MVGLAYVGKLPAVAPDVVNKLATVTAINATTPNQASVQAQIDALVAGTYATKSYVDTQDATFQPISYYQNQDALNVPTTTVAQPNGVASLDGSTKVPLAQLPTLGAGYLQGPYGTTAVNTVGGTTANTPLKIADFNIGAPGILFRPLAFMTVLLTSTGIARPVVEVRIANTTTAPAYGSTTLVAMGVGRSLWADYQAISVLPVGDTTGTTPSSLATTYNIWLTAWVYDLNNSSVTFSVGGIANAAAYLLRTAQ